MEMICNLAEYLRSKGKIDFTVLVDNKPHLLQFRYRVLVRNPLTDWSNCICPVGHMQRALGHTPSANYKCWI